MSASVWPSPWTDAAAVASRPMRTSAPKPRSAMSCGTPGDDPSQLGELAQERQAAGDAGLSMGPGHEEAATALLQRP